MFYEILITELSNRQQTPTDTEAKKLPGQKSVVCRLMDFWIWMEGTTDK